MNEPRTTAGGLIVIRSALGIIVAASLLTAACFIALIYGSEREWTMRLLLAGVVTLLGGLVCAVIGLLIRRGCMVPLMWASVATVVAAMTLANVYLLAGFSTNQLIMIHLAATLAVFAFVAIFHAAFSRDSLNHYAAGLDDWYINQLSRLVPWLLTIAVLFPLTMMWFADSLLFRRFVIMSDRLKGVGLILGGFSWVVLCGALVGALIVPVRASVLQRSRLRRGQSISRRTCMTMTCPCCQTEQQFRMGRVRCRSCKVVLQINVQEPHCVCGYVLYQLQRDSCPECGRAVPEELREIFLRAGDPTAAVV